LWEKSIDVAMNNNGTKKYFPQIFFWIGAFIVPLLDPAFVWISYLPTKNGWLVPSKFVWPFFLVMVICLLIGLLCFIKGLVALLDLLNFKKFKIWICIIMGLIYLVLMVAFMLGSELIISCHFGDCL
jgi:hypothetical protein